MAAADGVSRIGTAPLNPAELLALGGFPDCGGLALFAGAVRDHHQGRQVEKLIYSAYLPVCERLLAEAEAAAREKFGAPHVAVRHRIGELVVGELAIVCVAAAPHRAEAFAACRWVVDRVKHQAPIWKEEFYADGNSEFVEGCCLHDAGDEPSLHDHRRHS